MARDRQRAKQRRAKRQPGAGGPAAGSASTNARDIGLDQADADDAGLGNTTPPEPTKHGMPHVEEAHMAEAGPVDVRRARTTGEGAHDEVEGDLVPDRPPGRRGARRPRAARASAAAGVISFLGPLRRRAQARPVARPPPGRPGHGRHARVHGSRRRLPRVCSTRSGSPSSKPFSKSKASPLRNVPLVRHQHLLGSREQGQAEPRAPRRLAHRSSAPCARSSCRPRPSRR